MIFAHLTNKPVAIYLDSRTTAFSVVRGILLDSGVMDGWLKLEPWATDSPFYKVTTCVQTPTYVYTANIVMVQELKEENVENAVKGITTVGKQ
jgi:hypothetical protein